MNDLGLASTAFLLLRFAGLVMLWMLGQRDPRGWRLGVAVNVGLVAWALATGSLALIPLSLLAVALCVLGLWAWQKPQTRPYVVQLESEVAELVEKYADLVRRSEARIERDGQLRHDRATYTRRLSTYATEMRDFLAQHGLDYDAVPAPPKEEPR